MTPRGPQCFSTHPQTGHLCSRVDGHEGQHHSSGPGYSEQWLDTDPYPGLRASELEIRNAEIEDAIIGFQKGMLTFSLRFEYKNGWSQGFHGPRLEGRGEPIARLLRTVNVNQWHELKGKVVRVAIKDQVVIAIGHPIEELWYQNPGKR